jgi:hypothetical protein
MISEVFGELSACPGEALADGVGTDVEDLGYF